MEEECARILNVVYAGLVNREENAFSCFAAKKRS